MILINNGIYYDMMENEAIVWFADSVHSCALGAYIFQSSMHFFFCVYTYHHLCSKQRYLYNVLIAGYVTHVRFDGKEVSGTMTKLVLIDLLVWRVIKTKEMVEE